MRAAGEFKLNFLYASGGDGLDIKSLELLEDSKFFSSDVLDGFSAHVQRNLA